MIEGRTLVLQGNGGNMTMSWQIAVCPIMATSEKTMLETELPGKRNKGRRFMNILTRNMEMVKVTIEVLWDWVRWR